ncbi:type IX secretion system membrane protein PorP/SprF [Arcicella sp. DC2W]|uniref:Type IX secretion system membrane protein PorP/SprF n=1 Tax=Arcicella gelida TaxID=2984195 RepID=A0ABU5SA65_9BACT|nr:type IX secretion system membrane protein PorP/SprF [Arcicella sp. DC2W]MEA5405353.1 type IX secretion system membrane protein PorP/SprF [Arcicella sp. DC2W]
MKFKGLLSRIKYVTAPLLLIIAVHSVRAQQEVQYSQYMFNMLPLNPAYAGSRDVLSATVVHRQQWINITGAPTTQSFSIDSPINGEKVGVGFQAYNDRIGDYRNVGMYGSYAYRVKVTQRATLAMGIQAGATSISGNLTQTLTTQTGDQAFTYSFNKWLPNFGAGVFLSDDRGYIGFSCPSLMRNKLTSTQTGTATDSASRQERHYFVMLGYVFPLGSSFTLKPSFLSKVTRDAASFDLNMNLWYNDRISLGCSWRTNNLKFSSPFTNQNGDAVIGMLEVQATDQIRFGYAYDYAINGLKSLQKGSHEFMLRYEFGYRKTKILTPRYF